MLLVSIKSPKLYKPPTDLALKHPSGRPIRILCIDVGMKFNQLRCFLKRGVEVLVCPWDYDFSAGTETDYDGLFISNGPGDPAVLEKTVKNLSAAIAKNATPIFGICLGHQLMARAVGARTSKMKFGNRGHNIPCTSMVTGKCHITSQNHGFAADVKISAPPSAGLCLLPDAGPEGHGRLAVAPLFLSWPRAVMAHENTCNKYLGTSSTYYKSCPLANIKVSGVAPAVCYHFPRTTSCV